MGLFFLCKINEVYSSFVSCQDSVLFTKLVLEVCGWNNCNKDNLIGSLHLEGVGCFML